MKQRGRYLAALACIGLLAGCAKEVNPDGGKGRLGLSGRIDSKTNTIISRSATPTAPTQIKIKNGAGVVRMYSSMEEVPEELWLLAGDYTVNAVTGENPEIAFDAPYYVGEKAFTVTAEALEQVEVVSRLANAKVSVEYSDRIKTHFSSYKTTIRNTKGSLVFDEAAAQAAYVKYNGKQTFVNWNLAVTNKDGKSFSTEGVIENMEPCNHYILKFDIDDSYTDGGLIFDMVVDTDAKEVNTDSDIILKKLPEVKGVGFDIREPFIVEKGKTPTLQIAISGTPRIASINLQHDCLLLTQNGIPDEFELLNLSSGSVGKLHNLGITWNLTSPELLEMDMTDFCPRLYADSYSEDGTFRFAFTIEDSYGKIRTTELQIVVMGSDVITVAPISPAAALSDIWSHSVTLRGRWVADTPANISFEMRESGSTTWIPYTTGIDLEPDTKTFSLQVTGLKSGTKYEYRAKAGSDAANMLSLTTDGTPTIKNLNFNDWSNPNGKIWYANLDKGDNYIWDSGNEGTSTANKNTTTPEGTDKVNVPGNTNAARLTSLYAGLGGALGKFAAGSVYTGRFIETIGMSGAKLEFGRPYTGRPARLKGYYKYTAGTIDYAEGKYSHLQNTTDSCSLYILLCDRDSPYAINTSEGTFIDVKNDPRIVAYGELPKDYQAVSEYRPFTINIEYRSTTRRPKYVVLVASASKYGDYFTGSTSSVMLIDEFSLEFD